MNESKNSTKTSTSKEVQMPLKGFRVQVESAKKGWDTWLEGMGDGRYRIHMVKSSK